MRLGVAAGCDDALLRLIVEDESLRAPASDAADAYSEVYRIPGPLDLTAMAELAKAPGKDQLRDVHSSRGACQRPGLSRVRSADQAMPRYSSTVESLAKSM